VESPVAMARRRCGRSGVSYLTARRFSAQDRLKAIRGLKRLKAEAGDRETGLAPAEIALLWLRLTGNPGGWTVTNIAARAQRRQQFRRPDGGRGRRAAEPQLSANLARPTDQGHHLNIVILMRSYS
jgi:hypothetical protein